MTSFFFLSWQIEAWNRGRQLKIIHFSMNTDMSTYSDKGDKYTLYILTQPYKNNQKYYNTSSPHLINHWFKNMSLFGIANVCFLYLPIFPFWSHSYLSPSLFSSNNKEPKPRSQTFLPLDSPNPKPSSPRSPIYAHSLK